MLHENSKRKYCRRAGCIIIDAQGRFYREILTQSLEDAHRNMLASVFVSICIRVYCVFYQKKKDKEVYWRKKGKLTARPLSRNGCIRDMIVYGEVNYL